MMDYEDDDLSVASDDDDDDDDGASEDDSSELEAESDDDDEYESEEEIFEESPSAASGKVQSTNSYSSDDDPERENCPICLNRFIGQDLGTPQNCEHTFCFECIKEWSKNINTCPIDRNEFNYIQMRGIPGGPVLRKVKVKVAPKEPEDTLEESLTLCELCRRGDREDRLLLCDGCDLAFHCECLDPPLFYIPIEEWFCPTCLGVLDNGAVAGPSHTRTRRVIPRTRASETVRSRVENLRSRVTPSSNSVTRARKTNTTGKPKKRKRRCYRKAIRKVVTLARTKKDMNAGQKGKLGSRSSTVIVTYRRRRRRCKRRRKGSRKSATSTKVLTIPSSKQRIAKRLGISKPFQGSTVPQVKQTAGSRSRSHALMDKMPKHSLFGNKDQLMDFNENFNEDVRNTSSTSSSSKRISGDSSSSSSSSSSGLSILDSIMAGQKLLHTKSNNIVIKKDGSLSLKGGNSSVSKQDCVKEKSLSHIPMSIALAKQGIVTSLPDKNSVGSWKKHNDSSKTKKFPDKKASVSDNASVYSKVNPFNTNLSKSNSTKTNFRKLLNDQDKKSYKKHSLSTTKGQQKNTEKNIFSEYDDNFAGTYNFACDNATKLGNGIKTNSLNKTVKRKNNERNSVEESHSNTDNMLSNDLSNEQKNILSYDVNTSKSLSSSSIFNRKSLEHCIKKEAVSDNESDYSITTNKQKIHIKQEILSDDETNIDCWDKNVNCTEQNINNIVINIKKESIDFDSEASTSKSNGHLNLKNSSNVLPESCETSKNYLSEFDASQSIIESVPYDASCTSKLNKGHTSIQKIKEEIPSDSEDYSQSLILDNVPNSCGRESNIKSTLIKKEPYDSYEDCKKEANKEKRYHRIKYTSFESSKSKETRLSSIDLTEKAASSSVDKFPSTQALASSSTESEDDDLPCTQAPPQISVNYEDDELPCTQATDFEDVDFPCTQAVASSSESENDDLPCTQAPPQASVNSEDDELLCAQATDPEDDFPCTQAVASSSESEDDDLPCTQAPPQASVNSEDEDFPYTQAVASSSESEDDDLPCTQAPPQASVNSEDDDLPCTQAVPISAADSEDLFCTQAVSISAADSEDYLPCTQAVPFSITNSKDEIIPCTQVAVPNAVSDLIKDVPHSQLAPVCAHTDSEDEIPCTQAAPPSIIQNSEDDSLDCTQAAFSPKTNKNSSNLMSSFPISSNHKSAETSKMPSIQNNFDFKKPAPVTSQAFLSNKNTKNISKTLVHTPVTSASNKDDELSPTQAVTFSEPPLKSKITPQDQKLKKALANYEISNLSDTQIFKAPSNTKQVQKNSKSTSICEADVLPATQAFSFNQNNKNLSNTSVTSMSDEDDELSPTQAVSFSEPLRKSEINPQDKKSMKATADYEISNLPDTQIFKTSSNLKKISVVTKSTSNSEADDLPATQIFSTSSNEQHSQSNTVTSVMLHHSSTLSIPQTFNNSSAEKEIPNTESEDSVSFVLPATQVLNVLQKEIGLYNTGIDVNTDEQFAMSDTQALPPTQISNSVEESSIADELEDSVSKKDMSEIISNIKQLVNSLSANDSESLNLQNEPDVETSNIPSKSRASREHISKGLTAVSFDSKDKQSEDSLESSSCINFEKNNLDSVQSSEESENEELSAEKIKESLKKVKRIIPKKFGIHKHLPQVITSVPIKEQLKIKPSNKRTFSFEEVAKLEGPAVQQNIPNKLSPKFKVPDSKIHNVENSESSLSDSEDSLPATQIQHNNNKGSISNVLKFGKESETHENKMCFSHGKNIKNSKGLANTTLVKNSVVPKLDVQKNKEFSFDFDNFADLPATQVCDNISIIEENTHKIQPNNSLKNDKVLQKETASAAFISKSSNGNKLSKHHNNSIKRKNSIDDVMPNKRACNSNREHSGNKQKQVEALSKPMDINNSLKKSCEYQKCKTDVEVLNDAKNISAKKLKQKELSGSDSKQKFKKDKINSISLDDEKELSCEIIDSLRDNRFNKMNYKKSSFNDISQPVVIKQEKVDFEFVKPTTAPNAKKQISCLNVKIKTENALDDFSSHSFEDDSLPATQVADFNNENSHLNINKVDPKITNIFLSPFHIKKESCYDDDDDISIIEIDQASNVEIKKEIISIDDDPDENFVNVSDYLSLSVKQEKEVLPEIVDISTIKKEKCAESEKNVSLLSDLERKMLQISSKDSKESNTKHLSSKKYTCKPDNDATQSKNENQRHKRIESEKSRSHSKEYYTSKEKNRTYLKDNHASKEEIKKYPQRQSLPSENKGKSDSKDKVSKELNKNIKDSHFSESKTSNSKNSHASKEDNRKKSKDIHASKVKNHSKDSIASENKSKKESSKNSNICKEGRRDSKESHSSANKGNSKDSYVFESIRGNLKEHCTSKAKPKSSKEVNSSKDSHILQKKSQKNSEDSLSFEEDMESLHKSDVTKSLCKVMKIPSKHSEKSKEPSIEKNKVKKDFPSSKLTNLEKTTQLSKHGQYQEEARSKTKLKCLEGENENSLSKSKHSKLLMQEEMSNHFSERERRCSSEKENKKGNDKAIVITLKPNNKRTHENISDQNHQKKIKYNSSVDSESYSSEDISISSPMLQNGLFTHTDLNMQMESECNTTADRTSMPVIEREMDSIAFKTELTKTSSKSHADFKTLFSKQDLKEEIANEVKLVLKPFYSTALISKEDYKEIMRRAVPKIFMNCHNCINPEKIRKLVLNYVTLLSKS